MPVFVMFTAGIVFLWHWLRFCRELGPQLCPVRAMEERGSRRRRRGPEDACYSTDPAAQVT